MRWRATRDPYRILVSEVMLQQTQVDRVRKKYAEFIGKFPDVRSLASAPLSDVLRLWAGLGYNRRAKYLRDCATAVVEQYGGKFPREREALLAFSGIGPSTASAIRSFSFGEDDPMIDTNIRRVLLRVFFPRKKNVGDRELYAFAKDLIPKGRGREWNYAMLDLAATLCTARNHRDTCPFSTIHGPIRDGKKGKRIPFRLTRRFARGIALATIGKARNGIPLSAISASIRGSPYSAREIVGGLVRDGLVRSARGRYVLSEM